MKRQIDLALEMDPNLAEGYAALGLYEQRMEKGCISCVGKRISLNNNLTVVISGWVSFIMKSLNEEKKQLKFINKDMRLIP